MRPATGSARLLPSHRSRAIGLEPRAIPLGSDGTFEFANLSPGEYVVQAIGEARYGSPARFGSALVLLAEAGAAPVTITASPGATLQGTFTIEGDRESPFAFSLTPLAADPDVGPDLDLKAFGLNVHLDGAFSMTRLQGPTRFALTRAPEGWYLKSMTIGVADITDVPFDFGSRAATVDGADVVLSDQGGTVTGKVSSGRGEASDASVIVFPEDRDKWFAGSRYFKSARTRGDGSFRVSALPPGDYLIAAMDPLDQRVAAGAWQDPDVLESLTSRASRVTLLESGTATVGLRVIRP